MRPFGSVSSELRIVKSPLRNFGLAVWLAGTALVSFCLNPPQSYWEIESLGYLIPTAGLVVLALARREPTWEENSWWLYLVCGWSMFYPFAFHPAEASDPRLASAALAGRLAVLLLADLTLLSLGRSFSILPAVRAVHSRWAYALVRHPVYALYVLADACFVALHLSAWNLTVAASAVATFVIRACREERLMKSESQYRDYAARVRWRFLPGIY
jgi:protein-S-isoprenylcysteine O-methyltransferase Ste14